MLALEAANRLRIAVAPSVINHLTDKVPYWERIYGGRDVDWAMVRGGEADKPRRRSLLCPAAMVARYIARLDVTEFALSCENAAAQAALDQILADNRFVQNLRTLDERKEALGGAILKPYNVGNRVMIDYLRPSQFVPLAWDNRLITEAMFCGCHRRGNKHYTHVEIHRFAAPEQLVIEHHLYESATETDLGQEVKLAALPQLADTIPISTLARSTPLFAYITPAIANNIDLDSPLGVSRYADAIDVLEAVDVAFDELQIERLMAEKMIFVSQFMLDRSLDVDDIPRVRYNSDTRIYQTLQIETAEKQMPEGFDPAFRIAEHRTDLQTQLDLLCAKTGLDIGSLSFDGATGAKTATEIRSEHSKTYQTIVDNHEILTPAIELLADAIVYLAAHPAVGMLPEGTAPGEIRATFDDSITPDRDTYIKEGVLLQQSGIISKHRFLTEYYGMTEDAAAAELAAVAAEQSGTPTDMYGGL